MKDRAAAAAIVRDAERSGRLRPGGTILDATSGNTGIAYAMIAAARGYRLKLCVPGNVTAERLRTLRAYGAEVVVTNPMEGTDGAIREARRLHAEAPDDTSTPINTTTTPTGGPTTTRPPWRSSSRPTAASRTSSRASARAARSWARAAGCAHSAATSADLGAARVAPERDRGAEAHGNGDSPGIYDDLLADEDVRMSTERAYALTRRLATEEGLLVGVSSGAALAATLDLAARIREGVIVTVFPDSGTRYLTETFGKDR